MTGQRPWVAHLAVLGTMLLLGVMAAFALGTEHPHGLFSTELLLAVVGIFWTAHAVLTTPLIWKWGRSVSHLVGIHTAVLVGFPVVFGVIASIVS